MTITQGDVPVPGTGISTMQYYKCKVCGGEECWWSCSTGK